MAKSEKKKPVGISRKHRSRVEAERRKIRYIMIGLGTVIVVSVLVLLAGLYQTQVINPQATRDAKAALKSAPAVTVNGTVISIADWQARVRFERQLRINQILQMDQQLQMFDPNDEFGQMLIEQGTAQIQQMLEELEQGEVIGSDVLDQMVEEVLMRQGAAERGVTVTPEELQNFIEVSIFSYPYPPTPEPFPTTLPPTPESGATLVPTAVITPTLAPTPRSAEDFESSYAQYLGQVQDVTEMSEEDWRFMVESQLYLEALLKVFESEVKTEVKQIKGLYIVAQDQETANAFLERLNEGESFEALVDEIQADESEAPTAQSGSFDWLPLDVFQSRFGEQLGVMAFNTAPSEYLGVAMPGLDGRFYLVYIEGNEERVLADYLVEQRVQESFQNWLDQQKASEGIVYGNWREYVPLDPSL